MKVTKTSPKPAFQPIELKITIESLEELTNLHCILHEYEDIASCLENYKVLPGEDAAFFETVLRKLQEAL